MLCVAAVVEIVMLLQKSYHLRFLPSSPLSSLSCAGQALVTCDSQFRVMCVAVHPSSPEVFLCGGYSSAVKAWDSRCCKVKPINLR